MIDEKRLAERFDHIENRLDRIERLIRAVDARGDNWGTTKLAGSLSWSGLSTFCGNDSWARGKVPPGKWRHG